MSDLSSLSILVIIMAFLLIMSAIMAGSEMALASVNRIRVKNKAENGDRKSIQVLSVIELYSEYATTVIILNNIVNILLSTISSAVFLGIFVNNQALAIVFSSGIMTVIILIFGEIVPKIYSKENAEKVLYSTVGFLILMRRIFILLVIIFTKINEISLKILSRDDEEDEERYEIEEEILTIIEESSQEGKLEETEGELIRNAIEFNDIRVAEILRPKDKFVIAEVNDELDSIYETLQRERYSRIPVYEEREENIIGLFSERDFFIKYHQNEEFELRDLLRPITFVPDTLKISKLMIKMQKEHLQMVIVVDERGTIQGLITLEDIIEELVGDIWDEHDEINYEYFKIDDHTYEVIGEISINDFNELFDSKDIEAETDETTIAGYLLEKIEEIPKAGEVYEDENFRYEITEVSGKKIEKVKAIVKK